MVNWWDLGWIFLINAWIADQQQKQKRKHETTTSFLQGSNQLTQLPSNVSDYTGGDGGAIKLINVHTTVDSAGYWHVSGIVQNLGNRTIQELLITATVYNTALQPIDSGEEPVLEGGSTIFMQ